MSVKYQRIKQQDLLLPAPLRWLTRAFSSITLAVVLLALVALYGTVASVPVAFLAQGAIYGATGLGSTGLAILAAAWLWRRGSGGSSAGVWARVITAVVVVTLGVGLNALAWSSASAMFGRDAWFTDHRATVIYRLPYFEMTELEFYAWWPLKLVLGLFVVNLVWATIRRIEFRLANVGVLMVHTGIVTLAIGSMFYSRSKVEGDTIVFRKDLGGPPVTEFYDKTSPALYFLNAQGEPLLMAPLTGLPRYNDYLGGAPRDLDMRLSDGANAAAMASLFGGDLRVSVHDFISYGQLADQWIDGATGDPGATTAPAPAPDSIARENPALRLVMGGHDLPASAIQAQDTTDGSGPKALDSAQAGGLGVSAQTSNPGVNPGVVLVAKVPGQRVLDLPGLAVEFLYQPAPERVADLLSEFTGPYGLVVEVPAQHFRQVYAIAPGQSISVGDTGYTLTVQDIGPYGMRFVTPGYEDATDTRAMVQVTQGDKMFRRMVMHRYPERSQDFVPVPDDPNVGPMGKRMDPDPALRLAFIDDSKPQFHLLATKPDLSDLSLLVRLPGMKPFQGQVPEERFPIGKSDGQERWIHIVQRLRQAAQVAVPQVTPREQRLPKDEGTYLHALLAVDLETQAKQPDGTTRPWRRRVWLPSMRYPLFPDDIHRPVPVNIPGVGTVQLAFSRLSLTLPYAIQLDGFAMEPYPGTRIPRDFQAHLTLMDIGGPGARTVLGATSGVARLNNPMYHRGLKISQTGWDPGDASDPQRDVVDEQGRFTHQQRFSILGIGNNVGIHVIFVGGALVALGIPWAFYLKPYLLRRQSRQLRLAHAAAQAATDIQVKQVDSPVPPGPTNTATS